MTPLEWAAQSPKALADSTRRMVAALRERGDALHTAGQSGAVAYHRAARMLQAAEAALRAQDGACCDRRAVGRSCACEAGLVGGES